LNRHSWTKEPGVAIVTGAAGGIGRAVVSALREERWTVVATDRDASVPPQLAEHVIWAGGDIRDSIVQQEVIDTADVLAAPRWTVVHCAGGSRPGNYVIDDPESWEQLRSLNMDAAYYFLTRVARHMIGNRIRGSIIPIASIAYLNGGSSPGYGMAKGAVVTMGYALAQALGPYDITVNCIAPGLIDTPMTRNGRSESEFV
jgi:NAD(P)-dependent dehydrogenase (short-subunit alcohol dehydrogenase family)